MHTILITGANRGIGLELTRQYLAAGWRVIACCRHPEKAEALKKLDGSTNQLKILPLDVNDESVINEVGIQLKNESIDVLINNAGIGSMDSVFGGLKTDIWLETFKTNTIAPVLLTQSLLPAITNGQLKLIVNISSSMGSITENNMGGFYYYRTSKTALNSATKDLALDLESQGVTVVSLHPGWVKTDMGGANATLTPEESVNGIRQVISKLSLKDTGSFISYDGKLLPW